MITKTKEHGKVYYYTSNHQRVTGSQVISGISYNFGSDGALQQGSGKNGIDNFPSFIIFYTSIMIGRIMGRLLVFFHT